MTLGAAQKIVDDLAHHYKILAPRVRWKRRKNPYDYRSWYYASRYIISLDLSASTSTVLHEFAHALNDMRGGDHGHRHDFFMVLIEVVQYYYKGDLERYAWSWEYHTLRKWYREYKKEHHNGGKENGNHS